MKHLTFNVAKTMYEEGRRQLLTKRLPAPFPGRSSPTRVAWFISHGYAPKVTMGADGPRYIPTRFKHFCYVGKPNRYRALEATRLLRARRLAECWQIEFDRGGILAWRHQQKDRKTVGQHSPAYLAYHPHSVGLDIIVDFAKPVYLKRIGRMTVYSHTKKLSVEKLDAFYAWYEKMFGRKLKRPKQTPMELESLDENFPVPTPGDFLDILDGHK